MHLADLHFGKRLNGFSLLADQQYIWKEIVSDIDREKPDVILIAGDVYDKSIPSAEAVQMFDDMLYEISQKGAAIFIINGNHDSAERVAFGGRLMQAHGIYIAPVFRGGAIEPIVLEDEFGEIAFYLLPYVRPANVRDEYPDETLDTFNDMIRVILEHTPLDPNRRNILVTHYFVEGGSLSGDEERAVGGSDMVSAALFDNFDYTALGHLHQPHSVGNPKIRYGGSPLKYSLSEAKQEKSVTMLELREKGTLKTWQLPLHPRRDVRTVKGNFLDIMAELGYGQRKSDDYVHVVLTDEMDIVDAIGQLRKIYPNLLGVSYDNGRTRRNQLISTAGQQTPEDYFCQLYELQNNQPMDADRVALIRRLIDEIWKEDSE